MKAGESPTNGLEIVWIQAGMLGNPGKHSWAYFLAIVKCKNEVRKALPTQNAM